MFERPDNVQELRRQLEELGERVRQTQQQASDTSIDAAKEKVSDWSARSRERVQQAADMWRERSQRVVDSAKAHGQQADKYVRDYPWQSLAVAAAVGVLLGALIGNRRGR